jgi:hypothetical protein
VFVAKFIPHTDIGDIVTDFQSDHIQLFIDFLEGGEYLSRDAPFGDAPPFEQRFFPILEAVLVTYNQFRFTRQGQGRFDENPADIQMQVLVEVVGRIAEVLKEAARIVEILAVFPISGANVADILFADA